MYRWLEIEKVTLSVQRSGQTVFTEEELAQWMAKQAPTTPTPVMSKEQVRERVRLHFEASRDKRDASDAWIDARFDRFDADGDGTVDADEWEELLNSMDPVVVTISDQRPWGMEMEVNRKHALALTAVTKGSAAEQVGLLPGMVLTSVNGQRITDAKTGKEVCKKAKLPVVLGFDQLEPSKQLLRRQVRARLRHSSSLLSVILMVVLRSSSLQVREMVRIQRKFTGAICLCL